MSGIVKVAGMWELGWNTPYSEFDLWEMIVRDFGVDEWIMSPITGVQKGKILKERQELPDIIEENKELEVVYVDEKGKTPLKDFSHPKNVLYVFGKVSFSPLGSIKDKSNTTSVKIETAVDNGLLWPHQALGIILYDRMAKQWQLR